MREEEGAVLILLLTERAPPLLQQGSNQFMRLSAEVLQTAQRLFENPLLILVPGTLSRLRAALRYPLRLRGRVAVLYGGGCCCRCCCCYCCFVFFLFFLLLSGYASPF